MLIIYINAYLIQLAPGVYTVDNDYSGQKWEELSLTVASIDALKVEWMPVASQRGGFHEIEIYVGQSELIN